MALIKGIPVILYEQLKTGEDEANEPIYAKTPVTVENVLVAPIDASAVVTELQMKGRHLVYELCIPKGDTHAWEGCSVEFFGKRFQVCGSVQQYIEDLVPLCWNKKVRVERFE